MSLLSGDVRVAVPHPSWLKLWFVDYPVMAVAWCWRSAHRHPKLWASVVVSGFVCALLDMSPGYLLYLVPLLVPWRMAHPESFRRWVTMPLRQDWRRWWRYERHWATVAHEHGLAKRHPGALDAVPPIRRVRCHAGGDTVWVHALYNQTVQNYREVAGGIERGGLAKAFCAREVRAFDAPKGQIRLEFMYGPDPLAQVVPALPIPASSTDVDLAAIPIGVTEDGAPWTISVLLHNLIAGQTGSGKSGVLQGLIRALAPAIRDGLVVVWGIDPKENLELGPVEPMLDRLEHEGMHNYAVLLAEAVTWCSDRGRRMAARDERMHTPTVEEPLVLIVIDELLDLTDIRSMPESEKKTGQQVAASLTHLLRKGRAKGFVVIGALTDPRVDVIPMRHHFPYRIGMRLDTSTQTAMILGEGTRERGAFCESIPVGMPGVGYALLDRDRDAIRVRAAHVTNADIAAMVAEFAPRETVDAA